VIREHFKRAEESRATFYSGVIAIFVVNYGREFGEICKSDLWRFMVKFASQIYGAKIDESCLTVLDLYKRFKDGKGPLKVFKRRKDNN